MASETGSITRLISRETAELLARARHCAEEAKDAARVAQHTVNLSQAAYDQVVRRSREYEQSAYKMVHALIQARHALATAAKVAPVELSLRQPTPE